jgi:type II secretion system protein E
MPFTKVLLGELLIQRGLLKRDQLDQALAARQNDPRYLGQILLQMGLVNEEELLPILAEQVGVPYVLLRHIEVQPEILAKVPAKFASQYTLFPLGLQNGALKVAVADPFDVQALDELKLLLGMDIKAVWASPRQIHEAIHRHYGVGASAVERLLDTGTVAATQEIKTTEDLSAKVNEASVVSFVNQLLLTAVKDRATDIHIEPFDQALRIRQRVDGVMYEMPVPADLLKLHNAIVSRIKVMAQLDIAEKRLPQDGRIKVRLDGQELDLRISVLPTSFGETVEVRLLSSTMLFSLKDLGLNDGHLKVLVEMIQKPHGIIFVTGPTGSGKSTTLYACLSRLNAPNVKILTIEDPIEYQLHGITQLQVHPKIGFSFAAGLRSMLRHDPDIMMVGEVRDPETAEITIRSALTGHLVFSTLHTNDAAGGVTRLLDMSIEPYLVASSVLCFIAQRLVRVVCPSCADTRPADPGLRQQFGLPEGTPVPAALRYGKGCASCKQTGYKGRTAIHEILALTEPIQRLILSRASSHDIGALAQREQGMLTLRQDGWQRILKGQTTPEEVLRVT